MDAFLTCFDFVRVAVNHRHVIRKRNCWKIPEHIVIFMLLYLKCTLSYSCRKKNWYCNTDDIGTRSSSEIQEKRNGRKKVTFNKDM